METKPCESAGMSETEECIWLSPADRSTLDEWVRGRNGAQKFVWRARRALPSADRPGAIAISVGESEVTVRHWQERRVANEITGLRLDAMRPGRKPSR
jgi:hypothetical protein